MEKNKLMDVVDITNLEVENLNKVFNNSPPACLLYILKALSENKKNLTVLEKKINLGNNLLVKVTDQASILKIDKEKEGFEAQKKKLSILIGKLNYIKSSIEDFHLFFIFIGRFYTLAIKKENFESPSKKNSSKLIAKLKAEEEDLYNEYIDGNCFSKVRLALSLEPYESYFKEYTKNFFENIQYSSDPYVNTLLILKAVFYECNYFYIDTFNLTDIKFFLSRNIPINIPLPEDNNELVVLRCFFFYELLFKFLKLKPIKNNFDHLKKAIILDLSVVDYKANTKNTLISSLNNLKEALQKIDNKHDSFLRRTSVLDKEADVNYALGFYKRLEDEIEIINKKSKSLIDNKYFKFEKMQRLLAIIVNEANLPKFLEVFNRKIGNDFSLNTVENPDIIGTNKEALSYLFHVLCRDKFYTSLNEKISPLIKGSTEIYSKEDSSILDSLELEDLVEFSFYYIFSLLYADFYASLSGFNTKLSYSEMVTSNVFFNIKIQSLEILVVKRKKEIKKFLSKIFKNRAEYNLHRKNILEEIKLNLETIQDLNQSLSEIKSLETSLIPKLNDSSIPMPEKNTLLESLKFLDEKQKDCEAEYLRIDKYKFNNKSKSEFEKINKNKEAEFKEKLATENKSLETLNETLSRMSKHLSEGVIYVEETSQDINLFFQKITSKMDRNLSSIFECFSNLNIFNNNKTQEFKNLNLFELLNLVEKFVAENILIKEDFKNNSLGLIGNFHLLTRNLFEQIKLIIKKYRNCNYEVEKMLNSLSISNPPSQFFSNSIDKEINSKIIKLSSDYKHIKEQLYCLKKIINLFKCNTDETLKSYNIIKKLDDKYQKLNELLNKKIKTHYRKEKQFENSDKKASPHSLQSTEEDIETIPEENLKEEQPAKSNPGNEKSLLSQGANDTELSLITEVLKSTNECNKIRTRLEGEFANKERAKADLKAITTDTRYNFLISRIDPLNVSISPAVDHSQPDPVVYANTAPIMFFPAPPTIVVDTYRRESSTVFYPI